MTEILPATDFSHAQLCEAMNDAFSDYAVPMQLTEPVFAQMMRQRGLDPALSRVAVVDGQIAAIWLVSVRGNASYLISSGTRPAFRSKGIARRLANDSLDHLRAEGAATFQTEVMDGNDTAAALYFSLGMTVARHLDCYALSGEFERRTPLSEPREVGWQEISGDASSLRSWEPSWQNSDASINVISEQIQCVAMSDDAGLLCYAAVIPFTNTIAQIAVRVDRRRQGIASALIGHLQLQGPERPLRVINADAGDSGFSAFMAAIGARRTVGQRELFMRL